jgi:putative protease
MILLLNFGGDMETETGKVVHYFDKIGVAVIKLNRDLKIGDKIRIESKTGDFIQSVISMEVKHEFIENAKADDEVGMKVDEKVKEGDIVYLLSE